MRRFGLTAMFLALPALAMLTIAGCGSDTGKPSGGKGGSSGGDTVEKTTPSGGAKAALVVGKTGTLRGRVVYDGALPDIKTINMPADLEAKTKTVCLMGDMKEQTWQIGPDKGVENVVVWLKAPADKYFQVPENQRKRDDTVTMDQPQCAFEPHVVVLYPSYYDPVAKKQVRTGQKFVIKNSAPFNHNTAWKGNGLFNNGDNYILPSKGSKEIEANPSAVSKMGGEDKIGIHCDIHKWMDAHAYVFDHPYAARTDKDGKFEIKNAPAGAEVQLMYWHGSLDKPKLSEKVTLKEGDNDPKEIKIGK